MCNFFFCRGVELMTWTLLNNQLHIIKHNIIFSEQMTEDIRYFFRSSAANNQLARRTNKRPQEQPIEKPYQGFFPLEKPVDSSNPIVVIAFIIKSCGYAVFFSRKKKYFPRNQFFLESLFSGFFFVRFLFRRKLETQFSGFYFAK